MPTTPTPESDFEIVPEETGRFVLAYSKGGPYGGTIIDNRFDTRDELIAFMKRNHPAYGNPASWPKEHWECRRETWHERERHRFGDRGETGYKSPVWVEEPFWANRSQELIEHYAHRSLEDPNLIAFTENEAKGKRDIQTRMKAGRYLKRFFPDLSAKKIAFLAEWAQRGARPPIDFGVLDLKFATTPDEIVNVYENGPESCMGGHDEVKVYGAGDLAIAYFEPRHPESGSDLPKYPARALVWPEKKAVGRVYPTVDNWANDGFASAGDAESMQSQLLDRLKADGYTSFYEDRTIFDGARLLAIPYPEDDEDGNCWVMPYIDNNRYSGNGADGFFRLSHKGEWNASDTDGQTYGPHREGGEGKVKCENCSERTLPEDMIPVGINVHRDGSHPVDTQEWCQTCVEDDTFVCAATGHRYSSWIARVDHPDHTGPVVRRWADNHPPAQQTLELPEPAPAQTPAPFYRARDSRGRLVSAPPLQVVIPTVGFFTSYGSGTTAVPWPGARVNVFDDPNTISALDQLINLTAPRRRA